MSTPRQLSLFDLGGNPRSEPGPVPLIKHIAPVVLVPSADSRPGSHQPIRPPSAVQCPGCGLEAQRMVQRGDKAIYECGGCGLGFDVLQPTGRGGDGA
jgi:hypothetical protein